MKNISWKSFSKTCDEYKSDQGKPQMWIINKIFLFVLAYIFCAFIIAIAESAMEKQKFDNNKYRTVTKENWLGFKSHEYHER
jgi:hypothetical protein